jgi:hypothetical protein
MAPWLTIDAPGPKTAGSRERVEVVGKALLDELQVPALPELFPRVAQPSPELLVSGARDAVRPEPHGVPVGRRQRLAGYLGVLLAAMVPERSNRSGYSGAELARPMTMKLMSVTAPTASSTRAPGARHPRECPETGRPPRRPG